MISDLKPYLEYKDSNQLWLERIPRHWNCLPHRAICYEVKEQGYFDEPLLSVTIKKGVIPQADLLANSSKKDSSNLDKSKYKLVEQNDIVYNKMRAWQGAIGVSHYRGIVSPAYVVIKTRNGNNPHYYHYLFRTLEFIKEAERWSYGITSDMWSLRPEHFKLIYSCVPTLEEQNIIVYYLNKIDSKINRFIHNRQQLIKVLNEQKQAIITQAVTRGLDPKICLKPSGTDWLGDIPEYWEAKRLKTLLKLNDGGVWGSAFSNDGTIVFRSTEQTIDGKWRISDPAKRQLTDKERISAGLIAGDLLVTKSSGSPSHIGKTTLVTSDIAQMGCCFSNFMQRLRLNDLVEPLFVWYVLNSPLARKQLQYLSNSTTGLGNLSGTILGNIWIALPPKSFQITLLEQLFYEIHSFERLITSTQSEIDLIREYRTRLITDVVTGKLDVRHANPDIDEDLAELAELDEEIDDEDLAEDEESELIRDENNDSK